MNWLNRCHFGDCLTVLRDMPDGLVQTCVTSPPYFGLRDYGHAGQIGLETTPDEFIAKLVEVFREVRRVLRDDGTLWVNMGDSYTGSASTGGAGKETAYTGKRSLINKRAKGLKQKDLIGVPWMLAFALRADGWYLRQEIIWSKPNPMPESVRDRCTKSHEQIFLLAKSANYYYDQKAILEPVSPNTHARLSQDVQNQVGSERANGGAKTNGNMKAVGRKFDTGEQSQNKNNPSFDEAMAIMPNERNKRSVWTVSTKPYKGAHFATFPPDLIEPCVLAGAPTGGVVLDPFFGSGTTGQVAQQLGRKFIGIELNPSYKPLQDERLRQTSLELIAA